MTRQEFESLKVGDYVIHGFGHVGRIVELDERGYVARDPGFAPGDKTHWDIYFAWNEGSIIQDYLGKEIPMELSDHRSKSVIEKRYSHSIKELKDMPLENNRFYLKYYKDILKQL